MTFMYSDLHVYAYSEEIWCAALVATYPLLLWSCRGTRSRVWRWLVFVSFYMLWVSILLYVSILGLHQDRFWVAEGIVCNEGSFVMISCNASIALTCVSSKRQRISFFSNFLSGDVLSDVWNELRYDVIICRYLWGSTLLVGKGMLKIDLVFFCIWFYSACCYHMTKKRGFTHFKDTFVFVELEARSSDFVEDFSQFTVSFCYAFAKYDNVILFICNAIKCKTTDYFGNFLLENFGSAMDSKW